MERANTTCCWLLVKYKNKCFSTILWTQRSQYVLKDLGLASIKTKQKKYNFNIGKHIKNTIVIKINVHYILL